MNAGKSPGGRAAEQGAGADRAYGAAAHRQGVGAPAKAGE